MAVPDAGDRRHITTAGVSVSATPVRDQIRRRRPGRPGVAAAATTAVLATGEGAGVTALATTAVFATGAPMTPTRPTRARLRGMFSLLPSRMLHRPRWRR